MYSYTPHATTGPWLVSLNSRFHVHPPPIRYKTYHRCRVTNLVRCVFHFSLVHCDLSFQFFLVLLWRLREKGEGRAPKKVLYGEATFRVPKLFHRLKNNYWTIDREAVTLCYPSTENTSNIKVIRSLPIKSATEISEAVIVQPKQQIPRVGRFKWDKYFIDFFSR